jgi:hypothetical protein
VRPGSGHLCIGAVLLAAGIGVTVVSKEVVWYGAIVVGVIEIARGIHKMTRARHSQEMRE